MMTQPLKIVVKTPMSSNDPLDDDKWWAKKQSGYREQDEWDTAVHGLN